METVLIILILILVALNTRLLYKIEIKPYIPKKSKPETIEKPKLSREEEEKQKMIKNAFDNLMNYDENIARRIRK